MTDAAALMDRMYRGQRHIYDATRKYYLLGRDALIGDVRAQPGDAALEIGCGTGRNLIALARAYPEARCYGLDVSAEMLKSAKAAVERKGLAGRIALAQADATSFDPEALFGRAAFDRIVISYALSMIPPWREALSRALDVLAPGGALHIVDFGDMAGLPAPFKAALRRWLAAFEVSPRQTLPAELRTMAEARGMTSESTAPYRGYAVQGVARRPA